MLKGELEITGEIPWASNYTFLGRICGGDGDLKVVYKPKKGETPLWDFPSGTLCMRETAAYHVSEGAGFGFVPATVLREGPLGLGAVQLFIEHDPSVTAFDLSLDSTPALRRIALFDLIVNNADRKAGHVLLATKDGKVWAVDHGICFHDQPKLRTVLWDFAGDEFTNQETADAEAACKVIDRDLASTIAPLLLKTEIEALRRRAGEVLEAGAFPAPGPGRRYPWPPV